MEILLKFSEKLSELMQIRNIKSEALGKAIQIDGSTIRRWLRRDSKINLTNLLKLADFFACTIDFLVGRSETELKFPSLTPPPFGIALRKVMAERGYTQYRLDKTTKFKSSYIYKWDHGSPPDLFTLIDLANLFEVSIDYLVGREN